MAWIVVREEKHVDDKFWVCLEQDDALKIANDVAAYWTENYDANEEDIDRTNYGDQIFNCDAEDKFRVYVIPQDIRSAGQHEINRRAEEAY